MRISKVLLILLAVALVAAAVLVWYLSRPEPVVVPATPEPEGPTRVGVTAVAVRSPDLAVGAAEVRAAVYPDYSSWLVKLPCAEAAGCAGKLALDIAFHTGGEDRVISLTGRFDVPNGGELRFEGLDNRPTAVERLDSITLRVVERAAPGEPAREEEIEL
ncbi:MAG: hypothetical protein MUC56_11275 [Thermoanaerobaculales bacterium]|nr:hypothetical protein [Thermoanaerobaculales bacterium]